MNRGLTISLVVHACALVLALFAISAQPMASPPVDMLPVSFVSEKDFTKLTQGAKNAPLSLPKEAPKPLADKIGDLKQVDQLAPKAVDKPPITTEAKPKSDPKPQAKPDPKQAEKPKPPEYKPDQIADLLKKDVKKDPPKKVDDTTPQKPDQNSPKFDTNQIAQLLDKRDPQRQIATADAINDKPSLGAATGAQAAQLSQSEIDALRSRLMQCWSPPPGVDAATKLRVALRVLLKPDGSLAQPAVVAEIVGASSTLGPAFVESAQRAILQCQPFTMLKPEHYDQWRDLTLDFDPHEYFGG
jgi:outer membrane biosynthesis protein TonB